MGKRNPEEFLASAEVEIDTAWKKLQIFNSDRPTALLKLISATDDRMRIALIAGADPAVYSSVILRFCQEALMFGIPWIFSICPPSKNPIPEFVTEEGQLEGIALSEYAEAYDSAVIAFTNYHLKRFNAFVAANDRRITFTHASIEVETAELEREAYEMYELETLGEESALSKGRIEALVSLRDAVSRNFKRGSGDRVELDVDDPLLVALRVVSEGVRAGQLAQMDDSQVLAGMEYGKIRCFHAALGALLHAQQFLHISKAVKDIEGGAVSSLALRMGMKQLQATLAEIAELELGDVSKIADLMSFDGTIPNMPSICQPLIRANEAEVIVPHVYVLGGRFERNFLKLLAKNPNTKDEYDRLSSQKENIALPRLERILKSKGIHTRLGVTVSAGGQTLTDIDIVAFDPQSRCLVGIQHKWLIEPDSVNESKTCDTELARGIEQAIIGEAHLSNRDFARSVIPEIPALGDIAVRALVVSKGSEETGFLQNVKVPIVTEDWFVRQLQADKKLLEIVTLAEERPDRKTLASQWKPGKVSAKLAGYELRIPGFSKTG
ncbi:MAG TPA: hypothetical protein VJN21_08315 [Candidatus Acidoferrales bacterium]|nr:hypothetical protein [Candidatus Acidoferrales bacterium]